MSKRALWFIALSAEYMYTDVILEDGSGPRYLERDVLYVRAKSRAKAKVLAVKTWRRKYGKNPRYRDYLWPGENPFRGLEIIRPELT